MKNAWEKTQLKKNPKDKSIWAAQKWKKKEKKQLREYW